MLSTNSEFIIPLVFIGLIALGRADTTQAVLYLWRAVVLAPDNIQAQAHLGQLKRRDLPVKLKDNDYHFLWESYRFKSLCWYSYQPLLPDFFE